ncbi:MAG: helicase HerA-like domain-containing protein [Saprospiraceae bacterium]|nr:helicase HerA-like domain-containing protein [Saprospiraceae bacterium]
MSKKETFIQEIAQGYTFKGASIDLGAAMLDKEGLPGAMVKLPLRTMNRHGLIAGATGSGKTKTLQILAEQLSAHGVPSLLMDIKGDLSGIAMPGASNPKIEERHQHIGIPFLPTGSPVDFLSLSEERGARLRATISEFGPVLFSRILSLNDTQSGVVSVIFKYCDDHNLPLLDLQDFKQTLQYLTNEGKAAIEQEYGSISSTTVGTIMRKVIELEQQGAGTFFGERSFEVEDLCRTDSNGKGIVSVIRLTDIQDRPKLFSTFMLQLLAEIYSSFPEAGDVEKPKLAIFIDEAHLVFSEASKALLDQIEAIVKLIRSKGVGLYFVTQNPADIPEAVLGQLGLKIQHSLRAFTAKDRKSIKLAAENYPESAYYDVAQLITELGIGEAFVTALNEKGIPTPLAHTLLRAPQSRMDILTDYEIDSILSRSPLVRKYNEVVDRESAHDILSRKVQASREADMQEELRKQREAAERATAKTTTTRSQGRPRVEKSTFEEIMDSTVTRQVGRTIARELARGLLGVLGLGGRRR